VAPVAVELRGRVTLEVLALLRMAVAVAQAAGHPQRVGVDRGQLEAPAAQEQHLLSLVRL